MNKKHVKQVEVFGGGWHVLVIFHIHLHEQAGIDVYGENQILLRILDCGERLTVTEVTFQFAFWLMSAITVMKSISIL